MKPSFTYIAWIIILFYILATYTLQAQPSWTKKLPMQGKPIKMIKTQDGGYALLTSTDFVDFKFNKITLIKCDAQGNILWNSTLPLGDSVVISYYRFNFIESSSGGFIIVGSINYEYPFNLSTNRALLVKTDSKGDTLFTNSVYIDNSYFNSFEEVLELSNHDILVLGGAEEQWHLYKYTKDGEFLTMYNEPFSGGENHHLRSGINNTPVITKYISVNNQHIFETDNDLNHIKDKNYHGVKGIACDNTLDGGFIYYDQGIVKIDANLDSQWAKPYEEYKFTGFVTQLGKDIKATADGGYILCGTVENVFTKNVYLIKTDAFGNKLWTQNYWGAVVNEIVNVEQADDGGYILFMAGPLDENYIPEMWLAKTTPDGVIGIEEHEAASFAFTVYPNPVQQEFTLSFNFPFNGKAILYNSQGSIVKEQNLTGKSSIIMDTSKLPAGIYMININDQKQRIASKKIIKLNNP